MINTSFIRSIREGLRQTRKPKEEGTDELSQEYKKMTPGQTNEDTDKDKPGTQGDQAEYQKKRTEVLKKFGVKSCSELEGEEKKACYAALDAAHVSDDEEEDEVQEAKKPNLTAGMECQECGKRFRAKLSTLQYGKTKCPKCKSTDLDFAFGAKNESVTNDIIEGYQKAVLLSLDDAGIDGHFDRDRMVVAKRDVKKAKEVLDNDPDIRKTPKIVGEEVEIYEMNWIVGGVYHQEFKNGDKIYFRADSVQKNKRWKGMSVDEFGGRQKKAKNASADEKQQGWVTTPKNEIPKGLKEEIGIREGKMPRGIRLTSELLNKMKKFGVELEKYAKKSGGIDKDDFMKVAAIAKKGAIPDKSDIPDDTDPRDKVLSMMAAIVGDEILLAFKGLSPSIDNYIKKTMKEGVELVERRAETPDEWKKRTGKEPTRLEPGLGKKIERQTAAARSSIQKTTKKEREFDKKDAEAKRRYVSKKGGKSTTRDKEYRSPDYVNIKDIKKFPRSLASGLGKIISGVKLQNDKFKLMYHGLIPGMGITFPGDFTPKLFIEYKVHIFLAGPEPGKITPDPRYSEPGVDTADYKHWMIVYVNEAATTHPALKGKIDWYQKKEFSGKTADEVAKRTLQYLKTKVKRMAKEEAELASINKEIQKLEERRQSYSNFIPFPQKVLVDFAKRAVKAGLTFVQYMKYVKGTFKDGADSNNAIIFGRDVYKQKKGAVDPDAWNLKREEVVVEREMTDAEKDKREEIVLTLKKKEKEFKERYGDKWKEVMYATATKMAMGEELEPLETKKSKKKDKINIKPEMDENMKTLKDFRNKIQEHCGECGAMDHVDEIVKKRFKKGKYTVRDANTDKVIGTYNSGEKASKAMHKLMDTGKYSDLEVKMEEVEVKEGPADYLARRGTFEVKYASSKRGPIKVSKFNSLEDAKKFLAQVRKEGMNGIISKGGKPVKEENVEEKVAGWIAFYGGKKLEIKKSEADGIWPAKQLAIKHFKVPKSKQGLLAIKPAHEEVEIDEKRKSKKDFDIYHKTYTSAVTHAADVAKRQGYEVDPDSWETEITFGQRKPSEGKTVSKHIKLIKDGKAQRKMLHLQVYGMKTGYELNMYIEQVESDDTDPNMDEVSADLAYRAMDNADKKSRGNMSWMNPKRARKKSRQAQKFADYSIKKTLNKEEFDVNEAVTEQGIEYVESDFDTPHRLENAYPNLDVSFAKYMEEDLEGPYVFEGETYFFDRKMGSWFSVNGEDYVDEDMNKHLSHNFIKTELVRQ